MLQEKKLSVWWVRKVLRFCLDTLDLGRLRDLKDVEIPKRMIEAEVILDHEPCHNVSLICQFPVDPTDEHSVLTFCKSLVSLQALPSAQRACPSSFRASERRSRFWETQRTTSGSRTRQGGGLLRRLKR